MRVLFGDAFYFMGILNRRGQYADQFVAFNESFDGRIITTDWILAEVADAFSASNIRGRVRDYFMHLRNVEEFECIRASDDLFDRALSLYHKHIDKDWSFTDCTSFVAMRDRGITDALTGDKHFEQAGFIPLFK